MRDGQGRVGTSPAVDADWLALIDFLTLKRQNGSSMTDHPREREDHIAWRGLAVGDWLHVYPPLEFQRRGGAGAVGNPGERGTGRVGPDPAPTERPQVVRDDGPPPVDRGMVRAGLARAWDAGRESAGNPGSSGGRDHAGESYRGVGSEMEAGGPAGWQAGWSIRPGNPGRIGWQSGHRSPSALALSLSGPGGATVIRRGWTCHDARAIAGACP